MEPRPDEPRARRAATVLAALRDDPGLTYAELHERTGLPVKVLFAVLHRLQDGGAVTHEANRWFPTSV